MESTGSLLERVTNNSVVSTQRRDIQGLRALAVLCVVCNHMTGRPTGGFVGVDVFFVISGYLITGLLLREHQRTGTISARNFYARRIKRVLPNAVLVLGSTLTASYYLVGLHRFHTIRTDAVWSLFFAGNWHFASEGTNYFSQGLEPSPLQHFWSLAVEEQFYVVWPWLVLLVLFMGTQKLKWNRTKSVKALVGAVIIISAASLSYAFILTSTSPTTAYFSSLARAWELGVGSFVAIKAPALRKLSATVRPWMAYGGLFSIILAIFIVPQSPGFPAPWALLPVLGATVVIAAGEGGDQRFLFPLTNVISNYIGNISYSLYLWHLPIIILLVTEIPTDSATYYICAIFLTSVTSVLSYHFYENPIRRSSFLRISLRAGKKSRRVRWNFRGSDILLVSFAVVVSLAAANSLQQPPAFEASVVTNASSAAGTKPSLDNINSHELCLGADSIDQTGTCNPNLGSVLLPNPNALETDTGNEYECITQLGQAMRTCSYGDHNPTATSIAIVGDSHAASLLPGLIPNAAAQHWTLDTYVGVGCVWGNPQHCPAMDAIVKRLTMGKKYDLVITSAYRGSVTSDGPKAVSARMSAAWQPVLDRGSKVIAVADVPSVGKTALECVLRRNFDVNQNNCATSDHDAFNSIDPLIEAVNLTAGAKLIDMRHYFCDARQCPSVIGHVIVYRDGTSHLSASFSRTLGPFLILAIKKTLSS